MNAIKRCFMESDSSPKMSHTKNTIGESVIMCNQKCPKSIMSLRDLSRFVVCRECYGAVELTFATVQSPLNVIHRDSRLPAIYRQPLFLDPVLPGLVLMRMRRREARDPDQV